MRWRVLLCLWALGGAAGAVCADEVAPPLALPPIGSWLLAEDGSPAHWLGAAYQGRELIEPINVAIVDPFASSSDEALDKLLRSTAAAGFGERLGHSSGYWAMIGSELFPQISSRDNTADSDGQAFVANNHGRIFGPFHDGDHWVFVAALSRESFQLFSGLHHRFVSFNQARDEFAQKLSGTDLYRIWANFPLGNVLDSPTQTTADHDGQLAVLEAIR